MGKRICVLEDDDAIREIIALLLIEEKYQVLGFSSVSDFIKGDKGAIPDLFVLDVMLPDGNGIDVCAMLKAGDSTKHIPVLMMSANSNKKHIELSCGAQGFVAKPFDIDDFMGRVNTMLKTTTGANASLPLS